MTTLEIKGDWNIIKGSLKQKWATLTDDDLQLIEGKQDVVVHARRKKLTIFFSDIEDFTSTTENMQPEDLTELLNEYFSEMSTIALRFGATIDKFIGDAIMAVWGRIREEATDEALAEDACLAVETALKMREGLNDLNRLWERQGQPALAIGIGIHQGGAIVGNITFSVFVGIKRSRINVDVRVKFLNGGSVSSGLK